MELRLNSDQLNNLSGSKLTKWRVKEGDRVQKGDIVCEVDTGGTLKVHAPGNGKIEKIHVLEGQEVNLDAALCGIIDMDEKRVQESHEPKRKPETETKMETETETDEAKEENELQAADLGVAVVKGKQKVLDEPEPTDSNNESESQNESPKKKAG